MANTPFTTVRCPSRLAMEASDESIETLCEFMAASRGIPVVDDQNNTILHFVSIYGNIQVLEALVEKGLLSSEDYMRKNVKGDTALHHAARFGRLGVARILVREERCLVCALNNVGETPVFLAAEGGHEEVLELLAGYRSECMRKGKDGRTILHAAVATEHYYLASKILEEFPDLAHKKDDQGATALLLLAKAPKSFRSGSSFMLQKLGTSLRIFTHLYKIIIYLLVPMMFVETKRVRHVEDQHGHEVVISKIEKPRFIRIFLCWSPKIVYEKQKHMLAQELTRGLVKGDEKLVRGPLLEATKNGIIEIVSEILGVWPDVALNSYDECKRNILLVAAEYKQKYIYEHLKNIIIHKKMLMAETDIDQNTIVHLAARRREIPNYHLSVYHVLHLMWDVAWFQRIRKDLDPSLRNLQNETGKTATEILEETHQELRYKALEVTVASIQGPVVVSTFVTTVNFAALFTIPGGFHQKKGTPVLYDTDKRHDLKLFMSYIWGTLFASVLSLQSLTALHNPYHVLDYNVLVPMVFLVSHTALFYSTCFSIITIMQTYILEDSITSGFLGGMLASFGVVCIFYIDYAFPLMSHLAYTICRI